MEQQVVERILPYIGGQSNVARSQIRGSALYVTVKDCGLVDLETLAALDDVVETELLRTRLRVTFMSLQIEEAEKMASKTNSYEELANQIIDLIGGKENVTFFTHCVTRLRFTFKDKDVVDLEAVKKLPGAVGAQWSGNQLQVIIGQSVGDAYDLICKKYGFASAKAVEENLDGEKKKFSPAMILDYLSGSIAPLIPLLMAGGFLKIVVILSEQFGLLAAGMPTHTVLNFAGDAAFYFLPVFIGANAAAKLGGSQALGMMLGAVLIHPSFIAALAEGPLSIFAIPIYNTGYTSSVLPILLCVAVMVPVQKFFAKISPDAIRSITEPFLTMLVMLPLALCVLGPIGAVLGNYVSSAIIWMYETLGFVGVAVFAALTPVLVMTGMHSALMPYMLAAFASAGWEGIVVTGMVISNIDQGAACLAVAVKSKDANRRSTALGCAITAMVDGVTEPAMYGVNLPLKTPLYGSMIGTLIGAAVAGLLKARAYAICMSGGLLGGIPVYLGGGTSNVIAMVAGIAVGIVCTFIATYVLYKEPAE